jgi:hypothetical protein
MRSPHLPKQGLDSNFLNHPPLLLGDLLNSILYAVVQLVLANLLVILVTISLSTHSVVWSLRILEGR